jgi:PilZ domain/C4-dicarboxylate anaerobic carrier
MYMTKGSDKKSNRRVASRVYEQVNLFYYKINPSQLNEMQPGDGYIPTNFAASHSVEQLAPQSEFPISQSRENDTLNVNISASGIAFTCANELKAGDYLMLRILFLSSMTVVMTCCKVVYCKSSNPYENNRHPYSIGTQFVNMTTEDSALLNKHVNKIRKQRLILNGFIITFILAVLAAPEHALELLLELIHHIFEIALHMLHLAFEFLEMGLDHVIEHHFHTDTHKTQVIVFYVIASFALVAFYFLGRIVLKPLLRLKQRLILYGSRKKSSCLYFWSQQTVLDKVKIVCIGVSVIAGYLYFGI